MTSQPDSPWRKTAVEEPLPPEFFTVPPADPHAQNAAVRAACPVRRINYPPGSEAYVVTDYATALDAFFDERLSKDPANAPAWFRAALEESSPVLIHHMLSADPPEHTRLRKLVGRAFLPRQIEQRRPRIQELTDELIDTLPAAGETDLMQFASALPMRVICELLGVPIEIRPQMHTWGTVISGAPYPDEEGNARLRWASESIERFFLDLITAKRKAPGDDLTSEILTIAEEGYSDDEVISTLVLLIIAGHRTTANLIANGIRALLLHPGQLEALRSEPALAPSAVEEFLRFEAPIYRSTLRVAVEDMALGGVPIGKESFIHLMIDCANRDPDQFDDPDRLDITRASNRHLAFGQGAHFCVGAPLSRVEGQVAITTLLRRLPGLSLAVPAEELSWVTGNSPSRGLAALPVRYDQRLPRSA
jgi:cytochrome P450